MKRAGKHARTAQAWRAAKDRCRNPKNISWKRYGGRGIKFDKCWDDYNAFLAAMGECPPGLSIDRIDNDGNYEPGNCRWATPKEQARNSRSNMLYDYQGEQLCAVEIAERAGVDSRLVVTRLNAGWTVEAAIYTPKAVQSAHLTPMQAMMLGFQRRRRELEAAGVNVRFPFARAA